MLFKKTIENTTIYKHTQIGYLMIIILIVITILIIFLINKITTQLNFEPMILIILVFIWFILTSFISLTVIVNDNYLKIKFGYGFFQKQFLLKNIISAKQVKNHWYYGWGMRVWFWPYMWIYNVSGLKAVEIIMKNGKRYRIGTDNPESLEKILLKTITK